MQIFIKLWNPKAEWLELSLKDRQNYISKAQQGMEEISKMGLKTIAWFEIDKQESPHNCGYQYCSVYQANDKAHADAFHEAMVDFEWYNYFEQVNITGEGESPGAVLGRIIMLDR